MSSLLSWEPAKRDDRLALQRFECTEKAVKRRLHPGSGPYEVVHPAKWELRPQACIRTAKPPYSPPDHMWVGKDAEGEIGAAFFYFELDGPGIVEIRVVAAATRFRHKGGGCADEMLTTLLDVATERALAAGERIVQLLTYIDEMNQHSQKLFRRFQFRQVAEGPEQLQRWSLDLLVENQI